MANVTAKTSSNIFYKARCEAATHNEQLSSREGAADYMSIDRGRLYRIESGIAVPYPEEIRLMADLYNAPELENYFCRTMCPLGCEMPKAELANLDRITVRTLSVFRKIGKTKEMLLDITADASEKAQTGAILRVIRALLGIKGTYSKAELEKPFVVPTVTFAPDYTDPTVRRGTHLLEPMKAIVKELMGEGKSVEEIGKQLGMRPEEIFRLSDFSKEDFLNMMIKPNQGYSKAEFITKI